CAARSVCSGAEAIMRTPLCERLGIEFPLFAFSHSRDVVTAVSKAGGMGVFGAAAYSPERLKEELDWIDAHVGAMPYGVDLIVPNVFEGKGEDFDAAAAAKALPRAQIDFAEAILAKHGVEAGALDDARQGSGGFARTL